MPSKSKPAYVLPALRGRFGDWIYYSSMMPLSLMADNVSYVKDVHKSKQLSDMVQRTLKNKRLDDIVRYLHEEDDRFFNSLVLAVYGGTPRWFPAEMQSNSSSFELTKFPGELKNSVGFLRFAGEEKIIAIDGQHRLGGIKEHVESNGPGDDLVPVIFVAHNSANERTMERTRRLFTALNKHAQAVKKSEIIALDENDLMAIVTRRLVEYHPWFSNGRVKIKAGANIKEDEAAFTSIENIYDVLTVLFTKISPEVLPEKYHGRSKRELTKALKNGKRLDKESVDLCYKLADSYYKYLASICPELDGYFNAEDYDGYAQEARKAGVVLFRPKGQLLFANIASHIAGDLRTRFDVLATIPNNLKEYPYKRLMWTRSGGVNEKGEAGVRNIILKILGMSVVGSGRSSAVKAWSTLVGMDSNFEDIPDSFDELNRILG